MLTVSPFVLLMGVRVAPLGRPTGKGSIGTNVHNHDLLKTGFKVVVTHGAEVGSSWAPHFHVRSNLVVWESGNEKTALLLISSFPSSSSAALHTTRHRKQLPPTL
jgi:hypothetical protein